MTLDLQPTSDQRVAQIAPRSRRNDDRVRRLFERGPGSSALFDDA
jgi:hypothetical protein